MEKNFSIAETFALPGIPKGVSVQGYDAPNEFTPKVDPNYRFRRALLSDFLAWMKEGRGETLYIAGPTGCGKSSLVSQVAAKLNLPLQRVSAHSRLEFPELVGSHTIVGGSMQFCYGPLARAMKEGHLFLLDEFDLLDPGTAAGLNGVLEGAPLVIPENGGEVIPPHPEFRFVATGNTAGNGDETGMYQGTVRQNFFICASSRYPGGAITPIFRGCLPGLGFEMAEVYVSDGTALVGSKTSCVPRTLPQAPKKPPGGGDPPGVRYFESLTRRMTCFMGKAILGKCHGQPGERQLSPDAHGNRWW